MSSTFGDLFRVTTFGESHGGAIGAIIDGCPALLELEESDIQPDLDRRRPGQNRLVTQRDEADRVEILSGVFDGKTLGSPIALLVRNKDAQSGAYENMKDLFRPSHADFTTEAKYGIRNYQGGGRASARETIGRVAGGAIARKLLAQCLGIEVLAWVSAIGDIEVDLDADEVAFTDVEASITRCPDQVASAEMEAAIKTARKEGDSLGGVVSCVLRNVPPGLGTPVFSKLDAELAKAMISIPAAKGFEIGSGFAGAKMTGRQHNDAFLPGPKPMRPVTETNFSGGVQGGISNGANIVFRTAFKPTATIASPQRTVNRDGEAVVLKAKGRHDPCVLPRAVPIVEAMALLVLADAHLQQQAIS